MMGNKITPELLMGCSQYIDASRAKLYAPIIDACIKRFELDHCISRLAMFLAQVIHESGHLRYTQEIASGERYEGRKDLGNIHPGDGVRYKGRGLIMVTGRANYKEMSVLMDVDLVNHPEMLEEPEMAVLSACHWWNKRRSRLNRLADIGDVEGVTRIINGGLNGIVERAKLYSKIDQLLTRWIG